MWRSGSASAPPQVLGQRVRGPAAVPSPLSPGRCVRCSSDDFGRFTKANCLRNTFPEGRASTNGLHGC